MGIVNTGDKKYLEKQQKRRGLQKTRFYCQICCRQCLDENGFKCHIKSESHMNKLNKELKEKNNNSKRIINEFSEKFEKEFLNQLRINHGEKLIELNKFYQEFIKDINHTHLNSTRWNNITQFAKYLENERKCKLVQYNDNSFNKILISYINLKNANNKDNNKIQEDIPIEFIEITEEISNKDKNNNNLEFQIRQSEKLLQSVNTINISEKSNNNVHSKLKDRKGKIGFSLNKRKK